MITSPSVWSAPSIVGQRSLHSFIVRPAPRAFRPCNFEGSRPSIKAWESAEHLSYWRERSTISFLSFWLKFALLVAWAVSQILLEANGSHWGIINQSSFCFLLFLFSLSFQGLFLIFMGVCERSLGCVPACGVFS